MSATSLTPCPVCHKALISTSIPNSLMGLSCCYKLFHSSCIQAWINTPRTEKAPPPQCPLCRATIENSKSFSTIWKIFLRALDQYPDDVLSLCHEFPQESDLSCSICTVEFPESEIVYSPKPKRHLSHTDCEETPSAHALHPAALSEITSKLVKEHPELAKFAPNACLSCDKTFTVQSCPIPAGELVVTTCSHIFHRSCLAERITKSVDSCPTCSATCYQRQAGKDFPIIWEMFLKVFEEKPAVVLASLANAPSSSECSCCKKELPPLPILFDPLQKHLFHEDCSPSETSRYLNLFDIANAVKACAEEVPQLKTTLTPTPVLSEQAQEAVKKLKPYLERVQNYLWTYWPKAEATQ